ncbi:MAG: nitrogen fixation protein NifH, partial [Spirochaetae bacterium HGW-Spirochaetae-8]
ESARTKSGLVSLIIPCLTGNMVYALIKLGFLEDERLGKAIEWILTYQRSDDGEERPPLGEMYDRYRSCWGSHSCHMGVAKTLKALSAIPEPKRDARVNAKIQELADYFLKHRIYKKSHHPEEIAKPGWMKFGFPLMYQSDALEMLDIFASLKIHAPELDDTIDLVRRKQTVEGVWNLENSYSDRMLVTIEHKGKPSKWITLRAVRALREYR